MTDNIINAMKPQDQIIYLLGQIQGELKAVHATVESQGARQASINAGLSAEIARIDNKVDDHGEQLAILTSRPRLSWPQVITGVAAIAGLIVTASILFPNLNP